MQANALRAGMCVLHNNEVCSIMSVTHRTPGNLRAFVQVRMRNLKNGNSFEHRFASTEVGRARHPRHDPDGVSLLRRRHAPLHEPGELRAGHALDDVLGDSLLYMLPNSVIKVDFYEGMPVGVELPNTVVLEVVETEPGMKGATASSSYKPAKMQTGLVVQIPPFIESGTKIEIDTRENKYLRRV